MKLPAWIAAAPFLLTCVAVAALAAIVLPRAIVTAREALSQDLTSMETHDDLLLRVERAAPGFGGMFIDRDSRLTVYLTDGGQLPAARAAIESVFGPSVIPAAGLRAAAGQYTVSQLSAWTQQAARVMELPGVTLVDLDEERNRVAIGVDHSSKTQAVQQVLASMNIPLAAVVIDITDPIRPLDPR
jgi:hypothetical protein